MAQVPSGLLQQQRRGCPGIDSHDASPQLGGGDHIRRNQRSEGSVYKFQRRGFCRELHGLAIDILLHAKHRQSGGRTQQVTDLVQPLPTGQADPP